MASRESLLYGWFVAGLPTSGLDTLQQEEVVDLLRKAVAEQHIAVPLTSSVLAAVTEAHEAFTLSDGRLLPVTDAARPGGAVIEFRRGGDQRGQVLELRGVVKHFAPPGGEVVRAVDGVSLSIDRGEMVGALRAERLRQDHALASSRHEKSGASS